MEREGALPVPVGPDRLSDERTAHIRDFANRTPSIQSVHVAELLWEVDRLRGELERRTEDLAFLERHTLPELRRTIEHHQDGKQRWRERAETAEARVAELEAERHSTNEALSDAAEALREAQTERLRTLLAPTDTDPTTPEEGS